MYIKNNFMKILILTNSYSMLWNYREKLIMELNKIHEILIYCEDSLIKNEIIHKRHGFNVFSSSISDLFIDTLKYSDIVRKETPDLILNYTVRNCLLNSLCLPFIYRIPTILFIAGVGRSYKAGSIISQFIVGLIRFNARRANSTIFTLNNRDATIFKGQNMIQLPSEGIDITKFDFKPLTSEALSMKGLFLGRIIREKGIEDIIKVAEILNGFDDSITIDLWGNIDEAPQELVSSLHNSKLANYKGVTSDVRGLIEEVDFLILPSKLNEGFPRMILEAFAVGRPVFVYDNPGCSDAYVALKMTDMFVSNNVPIMAKQILFYCSLSHQERHDISIKLRNYVLDNHNILSVNTTILNKVKCS